MTGRKKSITREHLDAGGIDLSDMEDGPVLPPVTPGDVLREEFLTPLGLSATRLAQEMGVPANRVTAILNGQRGITAETAILLGRRLGTSARFWMNLRVSYELEVAKAAMEAA